MHVNVNVHVRVRVHVHVRVHPVAAERPSRANRSLHAFSPTDPEAATPTNAYLPPAATEKNAFATPLGGVGAPCAADVKRSLPRLLLRPAWLSAVR